jgi:hypothetical protein
MWHDASGHAEAAGLWESAAHRIVIKHSELRSLESFAGTLFDEVSGTPDVSAAFEEAMTGEIGVVVSNWLPPAYPGGPAGVAR